MATKRPTAGTRSGSGARPTGGGNRRGGAARRRSPWGGLLLYSLVGAAGLFLGVQAQQLYERGALPRLPALPAFPGLPGSAAPADTGPDSAPTRAGSRAGAAARRHSRREERRAGTGPEQRAAEYRETSAEVPEVEAREITAPGAPGTSAAPIAAPDAGPGLAPARAPGAPGKLPVPAHAPGAAQRAPGAAPGGLPGGVPSPGGPPSPAPAPIAVPGAEIDHGSSRRSEVALTFDAGSDWRPLRKILAALAAEGHKSTFFLTGEWVQQNPASSRRIADEGHELGNHSWDHPPFTRLSDDAVRDQLRRTEEIVLRTTGRSTRPYFRPPLGDRDRRVRRLVGEEGYFTVYWTLDSRDSVDRGITAAQIRERILGRIGPGAIVLLHCGSQATADALPEILQGFKQMGLTPVPLSRLLAE